MPEERNKINDSYKWDLTTIFKSEKEYDAVFNSVKKDLNKISDYETSLMDNSKKLLEGLDLIYDISRNIEKLYTYSSLLHDEDTGNTKNQERLGKIENLYNEFQKKTSFIDPLLLKYDKSIIDSYLKEEKGLIKYKKNIEEIYRYKEHTLDEKSEKLLSTFSQIFGKAEETYSLLLDADMKYGNITNELGEEVELTDSNYALFRISNDRRVRKDAFDKLYTVFSNFKNTISSTFQTQLLTEKTLSKTRKFNSCLEASLFSDEVNTSVYHNLIDTVSKNLKPLYRYYDEKRKMLNLDEIHMYDIYAKVIDDNSKKYSFDEAKQIVLKALSPLGENYIKDLNKAFDERWIDIYNNKGKRSGAYSGGCYDTNPFVLLNFQGTLNDVSTLAHELGHSMHSFYSRNNNEYPDSSYKIFVAEVASTVNELLLAHYMLEHSDKKEEKLAILNELLELYKGTLYRQTMFAEFELKTHELVEQGEVLTNDILCNLYYELNKKYFGDKVVSDDLIKFEWMKVPHFYYNFYVYKYATGISAATHIVKGILNKEDNALENYLKFLTLGGSLSPLDELKVAGVDLNKSEVIESAAYAFSKYLDDFVNIYNSK